MPLEDVSDPTATETVIRWSTEQYAIRGAIALCRLLERNRGPDRAIFQSAVPVVANGVCRQRVERRGESMLAHPPRQSNGERHAGDQRQPAAMPRSTTLFGGGGTQMVSQSRRKIA